jgi:hypothetical protein
MTLYKDFIKLLRPKLTVKYMKNVGVLGGFRLTLTNAITDDVLHVTITELDIQQAQKKLDILPEIKENKACSQ